MTDLCTTATRFTTPPPATPAPVYAPGDAVTYAGSLAHLAGRQGRVDGRCNCYRCPGDGPRHIVTLSAVGDTQSEYLLHVRPASLTPTGVRA